MAVLKGLLAAVLSVAAAGAAFGADIYPNKPVRIFVGFAPGGATDQLARLYAKKLGEKFNQPFIVENRAGGGGNIAVQALTQAPADGYTIAMAANYVAANAAMKRNPYDWERELAPIGMVASTPNILVVPPNSKLNSVADLIREAKKPDSKLTFGSAGMGSSIHLAGELFKVMAGVDMTHVPYKGVSPAEVDLMAGTVDMMFGSVSTAIPLVQAKKLKAIAVTGPERMKAMPDVPTIEEAGLKGYDVQAVYFMAAPAKVPTPILTSLSEAIAEINRQPDVQSFVERIYAKPLTGGPNEARAFLKAEMEKWQGVVKATGLKVD
ncbi:tripartite tricarboxylate transporter substrate binding protein [Noviherbaspirillum sp. Root189]|uniref:tripartite tricarboxylate transporter substrate binding protein n=1 Tax=Noviherbaspirillum sp. Root189 TaxID=1736487 RepID=UPI00070AED71|nr:tripartite tricarboxylate transporter substrate binding protein [Noviherbaspirillum sp. Root189]KRB93488.1 ABC transporter substrate-binding protein [Noviherbaspirillum sp. Root189]